MTERYETGKVIDIVRLNEPIKGAAITEPINDRTVVCSLAENTDIEAESFSQYHILFVAKGKIACITMNDAGIQKIWNVERGCITIFPLNIPVGVRALEDSVYARISVIRREDINASLETEKQYVLKDLAPYEEGKINMVNVAFNEVMQIKVIAMDSGTASRTSTSLARGGVTVLEGSVDLIYEDEKFTLQTGEQFIAEKGRKIAFEAPYGRTVLSVVTNSL